MADLAGQLRDRLRAHERRVGKPLPRRRLAGRLNVSVRSVYAYLSGTTLIPDEILGRLLTLLEVPPPEARRLRQARDRIEDARRQPGTPEPPGTADGPRGAPEPSPAVRTAPPLVVQELPPAATAFTGRDGPLAELDRLSAVPGAPGAAVVCVLAGMAGVGKTALALVWAHGARHRFPDGCLFADLRGYDPDEPLDPHEALGVLLRGLGLADAELPAEASARISRFRTLAHGRRLLIVLDNAFSAEQVRPLLPASASCFVLVTSREDLAGLVARDGARRITLAPLDRGEGLALLAALAGRARVQAGQPAALELVEMCAGLPLAVRLAAEIVAVRPDEPLAAIAAEIRERRLALLAATGDERADVRAVLSWSYRHLAAGHPSAARAFRALGTHPGQDFDAHSAAALLGTTPAEVPALIDPLVRGHLAERRPGGRFRLHDLLRAYAAELAAACDGQAVRDAGLARLASYCILAAEQAARHLPAEPAAGDLTAAGHPEVSDPGLTLPVFDGVAGARAWLDAERPNLVAVAVAVSARGWSGPASRLAAALHPYLDAAAHYHDALTVHQCAAGSPDPAAWRLAQIHLAIACFRLGRLLCALGYARAALAAARTGGDVPAQISARFWLGACYVQRQQNQSASEHFLMALVLARRVGDRLVEGRIIGALAIVYAQQRRYGRALEHGLRSLALTRELGDQPGEGRALCNIGVISQMAGHYTDAVSYGQQAQSIAAGLGDRPAQAVIAMNLAGTCMSLHRPAEARHYYELARAGAREVGNRDLETRARAGLREAARQAHAQPAGTSADSSRPAPDPPAWPRPARPGDPAGPVHDEQPDPVRSIGLPGSQTPGVTSCPPGHTGLTHRAGLRIQRERTGPGERSPGFAEAELLVQAPEPGR